MCELCQAKTQTYGEPLPGWGLVRATAQGELMESGQWGLTQVNDPPFIWTPTPRCDPEYGMAEEQVDAIEVGSAACLDAAAWWGEVLLFESALKAKVATGYFLYDACLKARNLQNQRRAYDPAKDGGRIACWLFDYLGQWLAENPDPIPDIPTEAQ